MNKNISPYASTLAIAAGLFVFYLIYRENSLLLIGTGLITTALLFPKFALAIHWLWMKFAYCLNFITSKIILSIVFLFVLTPIALIKRNAITSNDSKGTGTNYSPRNHTFTKNDLDKPW